MDTMHSRLKEARIKAGFASARAAALRHGWSPSTYGAHENGQNNFDSEAAIQYANAFGSDPGWLMLGATGPEASENLLLVGAIFAWDNIGFLDDLPEGRRREIQATGTIPLPKGGSAFVIDGTGLWPRYDDGDLLVFIKHFRFSPDRWLYNNEEMIVIMSDGERHFRMVCETPEYDVFDLTCPSLPTIHGVKRSDIQEAYSLQLIVPGPNWGEEYRFGRPSLRRSTWGFERKRSHRDKHE